MTPSRSASSAGDGTLPSSLVSSLVVERTATANCLIDRGTRMSQPSSEVLLEPAIDDSSGVGRKANFSFGIETVDGVDQRLEGDLLEIVVAPGAGVSPGERDASP